MSPLSPRTLRPRNTTFSPRQIAGLSLWLDGSDSSSLYQTAEGPRTAVGSPLEIAGCALWLDASDAGSITSSGSNVTAWADKSASGLSFAAAGAPKTGTTTLNGRNVITFAAATDMLTAASATRLGITADYTVFVVARYTTVQTSMLLAIGRSGTNGLTFYYNAGLRTIEKRDGAWGTDMVLSGSLATSGAGLIVTGTRIGTAMTVVRDGTLAGSTTGSTGNISWGNTTVYVGNTYEGTLVGDIAEIVVYPSAISAADRARVEAYLGAKWGISTPAAVKATANSDPVGYWGDKSGNARHVTQATSANRPVLTTNAQNGRTALTGSSGTQVLSGYHNIFDTTVSVLAVCSFLNRTTRYQLYDFGNPKLESGVLSANRMFIFEQNTYLTAGQRFGLYASGTSLDSDASTLSGPFLSSIIADTSSGNSITANTTYRINCNTHALTTKSGGNVYGDYSQVRNAYIGFFGSVYELIAYNTQLTAPQYQRLEGYLAWKWGLQQSLPWNHPYAASFAGYGSQTVVTDSDARAYLTAVAAADGGTGVEVCVARAIDDFVIQSKAAGIWNSIKASCILCGARTLAGALVPLAGTAPTNNNFVSADYNRKTGLVGGTGKYLNANRNNAADGQDDQHMSAYLSAIGSNGSTLQPLIGYGSSVITGSSYVAYRTSDSLAAYESRTSAAWTSSAAVTAASLVGISRASSANFQTRFTNTTTTITAASSTPTNGDIYVLTRNNGGSIVNGLISRVAFYSIGSSLDLATLDTRVSALYHGITYALNTGLSPLGYDTDALAYINAGYAAGGTLA